MHYTSHNEPVFDSVIELGYQNAALPRLPPHEHSRTRRTLSSLQAWSTTSPHQRQRPFSASLGMRPTAVELPETLVSIFSDVQNPVLMAAAISWRLPGQNLVILTRLESPI
jgi:hypothetical protein